MQGIAIPAGIEEFSLPDSVTMDASAAIPTVSSTWYLKYGKHSYYFMNFRTRKGLCFKINHGDIMRPGFSRLKRAAAQHGKSISRLQCFSTDYHYLSSYTLCNRL